MSKPISYYLEKGCEQKYAVYFASGRRKITAVYAMEDFSLMLTFDNGEQRKLDMKPILQPGTVFEPFMQLDAFKRVYLDDCHSVCWDIDPTIDSEIYWNNKVDLSPDSCYVESVPAHI